LEQSARWTRDGRTFIATSSSGCGPEPKEDTTMPPAMFSAEIRKPLQAIVYARKSDCAVRAILPGREPVTLPRLVLAGPPVLGVWNQP